MMYAREVIGLLEPLPNREFRVREVVRHVNGGRRPTGTQEQERLRKAVRRVLDALVETGAVERTSHPAVNGSYATFRWAKPGHALHHNRDKNRDNSCGVVRP